VTLIDSRKVRDLLHHGGAGRVQTDVPVPTRIEVEQIAVGRDKELLDVAFVEEPPEKLAELQPGGGRVEVCFRLLDRDGRRPLEHDVR